MEAQQSFLSGPDEVAAVRSWELGREQPRLESMTENSWEGGGCGQRHKGQAGVPGRVRPQESGPLGSGPGGQGAEAVSRLWREMTEVQKTRSEHIPSQMALNSLSKVTSGLLSVAV